MSLLISSKNFSFRERLHLFKTLYINYQPKCWSASKSVILLPLRTLKAHSSSLLNFTPPLAWIMILSASLHGQAGTTTTPLAPSLSTFSITHANSDKG